MKKTDGYGRTQIALHWVIAVLIGVNYVVSDDMGEALRAALKGLEVTGLTPVIHVYVGIAVLVLSVLRFIVRWMAGVPEAPQDGPVLMRRAAAGAHHLLYLLTILVPVFGMMAWFGGFRIMGDVHEIAMNAMMLIVLAHAAAALFHQYVLKDGLLTRMLRAR